MRVTLNYGKTGLDVNLPDSWNPTIIRKTAMPVLPEPEDRGRTGTRDPKVNGRSLTEMATAGTSACILICDITRPVPNGLILAGLVRRLMAGGIAAENITVLVATGLHRPNEGEELREVDRRRPGVRDCHRRQSFRPQRCRSRRSRCDAARHPCAHRPPFRRGRHPHRRRPGRAAFHGRLFRRPQADRPRRRPHGNHHHLPQRRIHGAPEGDELRPRRQSRCTRSSWRSSAWSAARWP